MARFDPKTKALKTQLAHLGRNPDEHFGFVNPPVIRASTVLFENTAAMEGRASSRYSYGLTNTPLIEALTDARGDVEKRLCSQTLKSLTSTCWSPLKSPAAHPAFSVN